jgi:AraC family transcriptional regulator, transcriptional activator of pobA
MGNSIKTYDFKSGLSNEIELVPISSIFRDHGQNIIEPHRADFYHIFWLTKGTPTHTVDFIPVRLQPDSLLFINKNRVHFFDRSGDYDGWILLFTDTFFVQSPRDALFLHNTILFHDLLEVIPLLDLKEATSNLTLVLEQIRTELKNPDDLVHTPLLQNMLHNLLMLAEREHRRQGFSEIKKGPNLDHTLAFTQLLDKQFTHQKAVQQYASQMGITERRLQQATSAALGKTPKQLVEERVLLEAKRLLVHTSQSIKEIGFELGFEEPTNFGRFFRQKIGRTPAEFRQSF